MEFRQSTQEDLDYVRANPFEGAVKDYPYEVVPEDNCYTAIFEGEIVAVYGLQILWEGVGWVAMIMTENCKKEGVFGIIAIHTIRDKLEELLKDNNIRRAQAVVRPDFVEAIKMIQFLGFKNETPDTMKEYFPDKGDAYLYSRIL